MLRMIQQCTTQHRIKISWIWIPYLLLIQFLPIVKITMFIFLILTIHEMAHILCAILFHYEITGIVIYPFGLAANINDIGKRDVVKEFIILAAGPLTHLAMPLLFQCMANLQWISTAFAQYLSMVSTSIMMFNLLPIYPLDGGRMMQSVLHCFFRFRLANKLSYILSIGCLAALFYFRVLCGVSAWLLYVFLTAGLISALYRLPYTTLAFYYDRYHHPISYPLIRNSKQDLYRCRYNMMQIHGKWCGEEEWLARMFKEK